MSPIANLETDLALPSSQMYKRIEFLGMNSSGEDEGGGRMGVSGTGREMEVEDVDFSNLYPAVVECFVIILCGYLAGRLNIISQTEGKGLNTFVGTFSLPALIFMSMAKLDFSSVNWTFLLSLFLSKVAVFFIVVIVSVLVYRPIDFGRAGLFAIFCTQSNDFALGYPIVAALYGKTRPDFPLYLYLVAPISLVILNPIGFVFMEIGKRYNRDMNDTSPPTPTSGVCVTMMHIARDVFLNPVVFMTSLGIVGNFLFNHQLPNILEGLLKVLGQAFSATALFMLGLRMVGNVQTLKGGGLVVPGILIAVKTLFLPLVAREISSLLKPGIDANETTDFSNYAFLYGTFPTAPGVFVFAMQYNVAVDMIASAMVACTFLSAPLMFVSAKMVTLVRINPLDYVHELETILFNVSIIGLICTTWVILVFVLSRKWRSVPHFVTLCLAISQFVACVGALLWSVSECTHTWKLYLQFVLFSWGVFSARLWTALLAVTLFLLRWRSLCFVLRIRPILALIGWGVPGVVVIVLILVVQQEAEIANKHDPNFQYGTTQAVVALLLLWFSLFTTMVCLILHQRYEKKYGTYESLVNPEETSAGNSPAGSPLGSPAGSPIASPRTSQANLQCLVDKDINEYAKCTSLEIEEIGGACSSKVLDASDSESSLFSPHDELCAGTRYHCRDDHKEDCRGLIDRYRTSIRLTEPEETRIVRDRDDEFQMTRHVVLLLFLCGSMIMGFALCMWTLVTEEVNGVYVELVFLDIVLNFGQGFFTAVIFGLDTKLILVPLMKGWRQLCSGVTTLRLPSWDELDLETRQRCDQFVSYHMDKCVKDIVRDRRWHLKNLPNVFGGNELVDWLMMVGLARDRTEAVKYGRNLLQGKVIRHVDSMHHFHDQPLFYTFTTGGGEGT